MPTNQTLSLYKAVNADDFYPTATLSHPGGRRTNPLTDPRDQWPRDPLRDPVTIVALSRLVYRKVVYRYRKVADAFDPFDF